MRNILTSTILGICFFAIAACGVGKPSPVQARQSVGEHLKKASSFYSTVSDSASADIARLNSLKKRDSKAMTRAFFSLAVSFDVKRCAEARMMLLNFDAQEQLEEKITADSYDKFIAILDDLYKSADNLTTNPNLVEVAPAIERLQLREAQSEIKKAHEIATVNRPKE